MINDIQELTLPAYATLSSATVTLQDMGEKNITAQVKIDGNITPKFDTDWEIMFRGEKYIMPLRKPQAAKENTSLDSTIDLTFQHWAQYQLKRYYFFTVQSTESDTYIPDRYIASVSLSLENFRILFNRVLGYWFGDSIVMELDEDWASKDAGEAVKIEISYSHIWDVLLKLYDLYKVRWKIVPAGEGNRYVIRLGSFEPEIDHILEYGFKGGLMKVERQVQSDEIRNRLLGRGGSKNIPYRYFKDVDPDNPTFAADPDWVPELRNAYFSELRSKEFRDYVKGWKTNPLRQLTEKDGTPIYAYGAKTPIEVEPYNEAYAASSPAYQLGHTDIKFNPTEFVSDDASIRRYGELQGALENNEEIYPTIQGRYNEVIGRVDEIVDIEEIHDDTQIADVAESDAVTVDVQPVNNGMATRSLWGREIASNNIVHVESQGAHFSIPEGMTGILDIEGVAASVTYQLFGGVKSLDSSHYEVSDYIVKVYDSSNVLMPSSSGLPAGEYTYSIMVQVRMKIADSPFDTAALYNITVAHTGGKLTYSTLTASRNKLTFKVWIKDIWSSIRRNGESDAQFVKRVWQPILGDREENEAKLVFSDGWLSISEDYEFTIVKDGITVDTSRKIAVGDNEVNSLWCLTLERSDADLESTGLYVPSSTLNGNAGDHFFFTGIDMPHEYVLWAEKVLQDYKLEELAKVSEITPTWVVTLDRVRMQQLLPGETETLFKSLRLGAPLRLADKRFIINEENEAAAYENLYVQSITLNYREPTSEDAALNPDVEIVLSNDYSVSASPVAELQGSVENLSRRLGSLGNIEQIIRAVGDKIYLRKDGIAERSVSPTEFANLLTSYGFRQGMIGGAGWGFYRDADGNWVLETDRLKARNDFEVNTLVVSQIRARGGMTVESAAALEITEVEQLESGNYRCYFDQKGGSVKNLFVVDDVALCHRFDPATSESPVRPGQSSSFEKFYKRRVEAVGENYVDLASRRRVEALPVADKAAGDSVIMDSGVNGTGVPTSGDVIIQYGNYTVKERQFVIVRDVVGGGYERFIEGLSSVNTSGSEYFFVGKQQGMYGNKARFFLGNTANFIEFIEGVLHIKANLSVESTLGGMTFAEYIESQVGDSIENYALGTGMDAEFRPHLNIANETMSLYKITGLNIGDTIKIAFDYDVVDVFQTPPPSGFRLMAILGREYGYRTIYQFSGNGSGRFESEAFVLGAGANPDYIKDTTAETISEIYLRADKATGGLVKISNFIVVKGDSMPEQWRPSPSDFNFMAKNLGGNTTISGGLVLTSTVEVGEWGEAGFTVGAGMSGITNPGHANGGVVFWGGGTYEQASAGRSTSVLYRDGTGHTSNGVIKLLSDRIRVGDYVNLTSEGLDMTIGGSRRMRLGNYTIDGRYAMDYRLRRDLGSLNLGVLEYKLQYNGNVVRVEGVYGAGQSGKKQYLLRRTYDIGNVPKGSTIGFTGTPVLSFRVWSSNEEDVTVISPDHRIVVHVYFHAKGTEPWTSPDDTQLHYKHFVVQPELEGPEYMKIAAYDISQLAWTSEDDYLGLQLSVVVDNVRPYVPLQGSTYLQRDESFSTGVSVQFVATFPEENVTELGANGQKVVWGSASQYHTQGFWGVRVGEYGLKIDPTGIYVRQAGSDEWRRLVVS